MVYWEGNHGRYFNSSSIDRGLTLVYLILA
jgi:hypothetical protein